jgi:hypothetical protein
LHVLLGAFPCLQKGKVCFKVCDKNVSQKHFYKYFNHAIYDRALMALSSLLDSEATFAQQAEGAGYLNPGSLS